MVNVTTSVNFVMIIGSIFGLNHFSPVTPSKYPIYGICKCRIIYALLVSALFLLPISTHLFYPEDRPWENVMLKYLISYWNYMNPIFNIFFILCKLVWLHSMCDLVNTLLKSVKEVCEFAGEFQVNIMWYIATSLMVCVCIALFDFEEWCPYWMGDYISAMYTVISISHFGIHVLIMTSSMECVTRSMQDGLDKTLPPGRRKYYGWSSEVDDEVKEIKGYHFKSPEELVHQCCALYHDVYNVSLKVNKAYGFSLLAVIVHLSITTVVALYAAFAYIPCMTLDDLSWLPSLVGWVFFAMASLLLLTYPCAKATNSSIQALYIANGCLASTMNKKVTKELFRFISILQQEQVSIVPLGIFSINYNLILTIIGSALSYLVILGQIQKSSFNDCQYKG